MFFLNLVHRAQKLQQKERLPSWVKTIRALLQDRCTEKITLQELAAVADVHPVTISKYFPAYFSCTLGDYMRKLNVEKALRLIKDPGVSLSGVTYACGFADQSHFIRTFKHYTGFLPAAYQKL